MDKLVKNAVLASLWLPLILVLNTAAVSICVLSLRISTNIRISEVLEISQLLPYQTIYVILGLLGLVAAMYWVLINATLSDDTVDNSIENADDIVQKIEEIRE